MTEHNSIAMLTCVGLAAIASACSTPSENQTVQKVTLPPGAIGHIDTQTTRSLSYTLREDDLQTTSDTSFLVLFGNGEIRLPLEAFYGPQLTGEVGRWAVDGRGRATKIPGASTPGFLNRLESMPDGSIQVGQTWDAVAPSDADAMSYAGIMMQTKRRWTVVEAFSTPTGTAVRVDVDGWSRFAQNAAFAQFTADSGISNPQPDWTPSLDGTIDVEITSGTLLGMKLYEDAFGDAESPDDLSAYAGSSTYCIDSTSGYTPRADICGWNL